MSQQINLFNQGFVQRHQHFPLSRMLLGLGLILLGALGMYGYAFYQVEQLGMQVVEGEARVKADQLSLARFSEDFSPQRSDQLMRSEVQRLEQQVIEQAELVDELSSGALGNTVGYSEYMRAFSRQVVQGLWLTGFNVSADGEQVSMSGGVVNPELLPEYIKRLRRERVMQGKTFSALQMNQVKTGTSSHYVEFVLHSTGLAVRP